MAANQAEALRALPSVEVLASSLEAPPGVAADAARVAIAERRERILAGDDFPAAAESLRHEALAHAERLSRGTLRPRDQRDRRRAAHEPRARTAGAVRDAPRSADVAARLLEPRVRPRRGRARVAATITSQALLRELTGAEAAIAVNNNAAAVLLALAAPASGREIIVVARRADRDRRLVPAPRDPRAARRRCWSRSARRTGPASRDYAAAIGPDAPERSCGCISRTSGPSASPRRPALAELCELGAARGVPVIDDLGSGRSRDADGRRTGPGAIGRGRGGRSSAARRDKLLGGPQAGIIVGDAEAVERCRTHPLARALRLDKLQLAALAATLRLHREGRRAEVPAVAMLEAEPADAGARARRLFARPPAPGPR